jgi:hypothetical protein
MENLGNLYIEPNLIKDERKATALQKKLSDLQCIDDQMRIVVQRIETAPAGGNGGATMGAKPDVLNRLRNGKNPELQAKVQQLLKQANSELNFSNFDKCYNNIIEAISLIERSA